MPWASTWRGCARLYVIAGGALAGLGGAAISLGTNPGWTEGMTAGRGWIAVALVIFAAGTPHEPPSGPTSSAVWKRASSASRPRASTSLRSS